MKQLTLYCSEELNDRVSQILHHYDLDGYIHNPGLFATTFKPKGSYVKDMAWEAHVYILFLSDEQLQGLLEELKQYINACDIEPCIRIVVTPVELIY